eukprot:7156603-Pyramimonas_sp.AAC.1
MARNGTKRDGLWQSANHSLCEHITKRLEIVDKRRSTKTEPSALRCVRAGRATRRVDSDIEVVEDEDDSEEIEELNLDDDDEEDEGARPSARRRGVTSTSRGSTAPVSTSSTPAPPGDSQPSKPAGKRGLPKSWGALRK